MKVLVPVKRVVDAYVKIRIKADGSGVDLNNTKMAMNPFDECALEEAVRLKEAGLAQEIIAISVGAQHCQETLRQALAHGADRAVLIQSEHADFNLEPIQVAKLLQAYIQSHETVDLVILGKQAIDQDNNQTGQMLAALLNWPQATFASAIAREANEWIVTREVEGGLECVALSLPAVITADLRLNQPRFLSLPNIMKAKQKPLHTLTAESLGVRLSPHVNIVNIAPTPPRKAGIKLANVDELVHCLRNDAQVI